MTDDEKPIEQLIPPAQLVRKMPRPAEEVTKHCREVQSDLKKVFDKFGGCNPITPSEGVCGEQKIMIEGDILSSVLHDHSTGAIHIIQQYDLSGLKL